MSGNDENSFYFNEDQQYNAVEVAMDAFNLWNVTPSQFSDENGVPYRVEEELEIDRFEVLDCWKAEDGNTVHMRCRIAYGAPDYFYNKPRLTVEPKGIIPLFSREVEFSFSPQANALTAFATGSGLQMDAEDERVTYLPSADASDIGLPLNGNFYACAKTSPLRPTGREMPELEQNYFFSNGINNHLIAEQVLAKVLPHAGLLDLFPKSNLKKGIMTIFDGVGTEMQTREASGQSGLRTFIINVKHEHPTENDGIMKYKSEQIPFVVSVGNSQRDTELLDYQFRIQEEMKGEYGVGTPIIIQRPKRYFGGQVYAIQEGKRSKGYSLEQQIPMLGANLGKVHNRPAKEVITPPDGPLLDPDLLLDNVQRGLEWLRTQEAEHVASSVGVGLEEIEERMHHSLIGRLFERFTYDEIVQIDEALPDEKKLCPRLELTRDVASRFVEAKTRSSAEDRRNLPHGWVHGDIHSGNILGGALIDWQRAQSRGKFLDDLMLTMHFCLVDEGGYLNADLTKSFFDSYCAERTRNNVGTRNIPLTQEEVRAMPEKLASLAKREMHPAFCMFSNHSLLRNFALRLFRIPEQMQSYLDEKGRTTEEGAQRFCREFLGRELDTLAVYADRKQTVAAMDRKEKQLDRRKMSDTEIGERWESIVASERSGGRDFLVGSR